MLEMSSMFLKSIIQEMCPSFMCQAVKESDHWKKIQAAFVLGKFHIKLWILEFGIALGSIQETAMGGQDKMKKEMCYLNLICTFLKMSPIQGTSESLPIGISPNNFLKHYLYLINKEYWIQVWFRFHFRIGNW